MDNKWLWIGGRLAAVVVVGIIMKSGGGGSATTSSTQQLVPGTTTPISSNVGTPSANNNSLLGFTDPVTGINWVLNASDQWVGALPAGALPPNYTPGMATINPFFIPTTNTITGV